MPESTPPPRRPPILTQVSPWRDPTHAVLLTFAPEGLDTPCLGVLATSQNRLLSGTQYALGTEYWYATSDFTPDTPLVMKYEHGPWSEEEVERRVAGLPLAFTTPQDAKGLWKATRHAVLQDTTTRRFTAPDPVDPTRQQIGLELTFTRAEGLVRCIWYRVDEPRTGYVWPDLVDLKNGLVWTPAPSLEALAWSFAQGRRVQ